MENEIIKLKEELKELKRELNILQKVLIDAKDSILILELGSAKILWANKKAVEEYGYSQEEFIGMDLGVLSKNPETQKDVIKSLIEKNKSEHTLETTHYSKSGKVIFFEIILVVFQFKGEKAILSINRNISRRKNAEVETKKYLEELKKLNENKDKFFGIISHDLRGPFNSLLLLSEYLLQDIDTFSKKEIKEIVGDLRITSKNLFSFVESLLSWSRIQIGKYEFKPVRLNLLEISLFVIKLLTGQAKEKNIILKDYLDINSFVYADKGMITSVLQNLIANAIKFTPRDGIVKIFALENNGMIEISISDSGVGISENNINKLFKVEKSFTTAGTNMETGTGLGLILCKEFINKNGGDIKVHTKVNEGTSFTFTLPKAPQNNIV